ncbi:hypothetical protein AAZV13_05G079750 [Glycine max]
MKLSALQQSYLNRRSNSFRGSLPLDSSGEHLLAPPPSCVLHRQRRHRLPLLPSRLPLPLLRRLPRRRNLRSARRAFSPRHREPDREERVRRVSSGESDRRRKPRGGRAARDPCPAVAASESGGGDEGTPHNRENPEGAEDAVRSEKAENGYCGHADAGAHVPEASLEQRHALAHARAV